MKEKKSTSKAKLNELPKISDRVTFIYVEHAKVNRNNGAITVVDGKGVVKIPVAIIGALLLGPFLANLKLKNNTRAIVPNMSNG